MVANGGERPVSTQKWALDPGCNAAITSPSKREAEFHAKVDGFMNKILDIAQAPMHFAASGNLSVLQNASESWMLGSSDLVTWSNSWPTSSPRWTLLAKMEEPSTGQLESTAAQEEVAEEKMLKKHLSSAFLHLTKLLRLIVSNSGGPSPKKARAVVRVERASGAFGIESFITSARSVVETASLFSASL